jgi:PmbA protein
VVTVRREHEIAPLIDAILRQGGKVADEVEVYYAESRSVGVDLKRTIIGEAHESRARGLGIRIIADGRIGTSSTDDPARWRECLDAALASGRLATPQEWHGLPAPANLAGEVPIYDPAVVPDVEAARRLAGDLLLGAGEHDADVIGGSAGLSLSEAVLANSSGVFYARKKTGVGASLEAIRGTSTGYEFDRSCFADIDAVEIGRKASFLASHSAGGEDVATGAYDIILSPVALSQLIGHVVVPALSGRNVHAGRSWLAGKIGEQCMGEALSLYDDPFTRGLGSTLWDAEGVPARRIDFVEGGELNCFGYDLKTAYRYGEESTASAVRSGPGGSPGIGMHNLVVDGPRGAVDGERAIWVHDLVGAHTANPVTGDFSVELSNPSWKEGGAFGAPIRSAMLAGNLFEMLGSIEVLGPVPRIIGTVILPPVRFNNQQIIGK